MVSNLAVTPAWCKLQVVPEHARNWTFVFKILSWLAMQQLRGIVDIPALIVASHSLSIDTHANLVL